jgi:hypothetical protein
MRPILLASLLALPLAACGGSSPELGGDVVGSWREIPYLDPPPPVDERLFYDFADDGTYTQTDGAGTGTGTWTTTDGELSLDDGTHDAQTQYYADDSRFLFGVLVPDDDGDDPVATWNGYFVSDGTRTESTATLKDDQTAHFEQVTGTDPATTYDGTWAQNGDDVELTFEVDDGQGGTITVHLHASLYQGFMGSPFEKI